MESRMMLDFGNINAGTVYVSYEHHSAVQAQEYIKSDGTSSRYLGFRDIPSLLRKYLNGKLALDYGSGTGISSRFLKSEGFIVTGVDISEAMVAQATIQTTGIPFKVISTGRIPEEDNVFDLVFSSLVILELSNQHEMLSYFSEAKRVLKTNGVFITLTNSSDLYSLDWYCLQTSYPENKNLNNGSLAKAYVPDAGIEFTDYFWHENNVTQNLEQAGFEVLEIHHPLGNASDGFPWKMETTKSPFAIFVVKKL